MGPLREWSRGHGPDPECGAVAALELGMRGLQGLELAEEPVVLGV
jgi:hypothetical protein